MKSEDFESIACVAAVPAQRTDQERRGRRNKHDARSRGKRRRQISQVCWKPGGYWNSRRPRVEHDQSRDGRERGRSEACGRKGKVESDTDLDCVDVRYTGGEHIVMRAVPRVRYGRVTVASDREKAERKRGRAGIYIRSVVIL